MVLLLLSVGTLTFSRYTFCRISISSIVDFTFFYLQLLAILRHVSIDIKIFTDETLGCGRLLLSENDKRLASDGVSDNRCDRHTAVLTVH